VAEDQLREQLTVTAPSGYTIQQALVGIANRAAELMLKYMIELGLTPASRVKLATGAPPVDDPLEQFLAQRKKGRR
jgi:phage terminase small subunit